MVYIFNRILFSTKREILPFVTTQKDLENIMLSEKFRKRQISYDLTYMYNLKTKLKTTR